MQSDVMGISLSMKKFILIMKNEFTNVKLPDALTLMALMLSFEWKFKMFGARL